MTFLYGVAVGGLVSSVSFIVGRYCTPVPKFTLEMHGVVRPNPRVVSSGPNMKRIRVFDQDA